MKNITTLTQGASRHQRKVSTYSVLLRTIAFVTAFIAGHTTAWANDAKPWLKNTFDRGDGFSLSSLCGQKNWKKYWACPQVVSLGADENADYALLIDPHNGQTIDTYYETTPQSTRWQVIEFDVKVGAGAVDPSLAKFQINTNGNPSERKFQFYIGNGMRANYGPSGQIADIVPAGEMILDRWYRVRLEMDLSTERLDVWAAPYAESGDDRGIARLVRRATGLAMRPGGITGLDLWGWDRPGDVVIDNLVGYAQIARITNPLREVETGGVVDVDIARTSLVDSFQLFVDGTVVASGTGNTTHFEWDSTVNPLHAPIHPGFGGRPLGFGYFFTRYQGGDNHWSTVNRYTNLYHAWAGQQYGTTDERAAVWLERMRDDLVNISRNQNEDVPIVLNLNLQPNGWIKGYSEVDYRPVLSLFVEGSNHPDWSKVVAVELCNDCTKWNPAEYNILADRVHNHMTAVGLPWKPFGVVIENNGYLENGKLPPVLPNRSSAPLQADFVTYEAYLSSPDKVREEYYFSPLSHENMARIRDNMRNAFDTLTLLANIAPPLGGDLDVIIDMPAYTQSGAWRNADLVRDIQVPAYEEARRDPRVRAIQMFAYARPSGTKDHPRFRVPHKLIGDAIKGGVLDAGRGRRTLALRACKAGETDCTWDTIYLGIQN